MASEVTVSFKAYLCQNGSQENPEVRRFGVDRDVVSSFTYLKEKLQTVFPSLKRTIFTVSWKDADEDDVLISSDEELIIALTEGKSDLYKLFVDVKGHLKDVPEAMHVEDAAPRDDVHVGVICDGCSGPVEGFRYKCAMCQDYDLCSSCEAKGVHSEHIMLRLPAPHMWLPRFKHNLVHRLSKSVRKSEGKRDEDGHRRWRGKHGNERHCSPDDHCHGKHGHDRRCSPEEHRPRESAEQSGNQRSGCPMRDQASRPSFMDFVSSYLGENISKDNMESKEYLKTIGRTVAQFLDPLGIAVNVEVRTDDDAQSTKQAEAEKSGQKASAENKQKVHFADSGNSSNNAANPTPPASEVVCENVEMIEETSQPLSSQAPRADGSDPELEHWTVVNDAGSSAPAEEEPEVQILPTPSAPANTEASPQTLSTATPNVAAMAAQAHRQAFATAIEAHRQAAAAAAAEARHQARTSLNYAGAAGAFTVPQGMHYPTLSSAAVPQPHQLVPTTQTDSVSAPAHPDPKIARAVTMMLNMGFSNDGGWLTQLLASKNGDISQALDVLQPVKRA